MNNKLKAFIGLLGSDQPGEVANAAAMLVKALKADGKDLHWLAGLAAGEKPKAGFGRGDSFDLYAQMAMMAKVAEAQAQANAYKREIGLLKGEVERLRHELDMIRMVAAKGPMGTEDPLAAMQANMYARNAQNTYRSSTAYWTENPFGGQRQTKPEWRDMARYCYEIGGRFACLRSDEDQFLLDMLERPKLYVPSYKQLRWLEDIYDRVRRVEAAYKGY